MSMSPSESPSRIFVKPSVKDAVRVSPRALMLVGLSVVSMILLVFFVVLTRGKPDTSAMGSHGGNQKALRGAKPPENIASAAGTNADASTGTTFDKMKSAVGMGESTASMGATHQAVPSEEILKEQAEFDREVRRFHHKQRMDRLARADAANGAEIEGNAGANRVMMEKETGSPEPGSESVATLQQLPNGQRVLGASPGGPGTEDPNMQGRKESFAEQAKLSGYLPYKKEVPLSPYEVKQGTVIPAVMITGINSDLPGQIIAQVSQPVFDTVSGRYLLIPQGTRLVGSYDSYVAVGQERALVAWRRLIFPDGASLELMNMPGADPQGYSGFADQVNNHYFRIFGGAILIGMIGAGYQATQPIPRYG